MNSCDLPLSSLLSQVLVAFTIEFDNEFEHQMLHRTTDSRGKSERNSWHSSMVMWSNFMRFVPEEGRTVAEIESLSRTARLPLAGMVRWGYVDVEPNPIDSLSKPSRPDRIVRPTRGGRTAQEVWRPLCAAIEKRWRERFGTQEVALIRDTLVAMLSSIDSGLPDYLPIVGYGLWSKDLITQAPSMSKSERGDGLPLDLSTLLSRVLLVFATEFESESRFSLAISANVLRVISMAGGPIRDLRGLTGVSKEAIDVSVSFLGTQGAVVVEPSLNRSRTKVVRLTPQGQEAQETYCERRTSIEERWTQQFGSGVISRLRESLLRLYEADEGGLPRLTKGLAPYQDGWRASEPYLAQTTAILRDPSSALPQFPIVTHRGGYPDGN